MRFPAWVLVMVFGAVHGGAEESVATVRFLPEVRVAGGSIRLGQIAEISGPKNFTVELDTLNVGPAADFGLTRWVDGEAVALHLQSRFPGRLLVGNPKTRVAVTTAADTLPQDSLSARVLAFLSRQPAAPGGQWHFTWSGTPPVITVPKTPYQMDLDFSTRKHRGQVALALTISVGGSLLRTYPLAADFTVDEPVRVAVRRIERHEPISTANTRLEMRETTPLHPGAVPDPTQVLGMLAKRPLLPDEILTMACVAWPPVVHRGQQAPLVVRYGVIRAATEVVCRQDGVPGEVISVRQPETHRLLRARVLDDGSLEPVLEGGT